MKNKINKKKIKIFFGIAFLLTLTLQGLNYSSKYLKIVPQYSNVRTSATNEYTFLMNKTWGGIENDVGYDIALDTSGNIYITGVTNNSDTVDNDAFIAKYDNSGILKWNITWGGGDNDCGNGIALDLSGNIYITGYTTSFGAGNNDAFIAKYDNSGILKWNTTWGGGDNDCGNGIALDISGNIYITGYTTSFGAGNYDAFIAIYNSTGTLQWNTTWGGDNIDQGNGIIVDLLNNIFITGSTKSFTVGNDDGFLAMYDSNGVQQWNTTWGGSGWDYGSDISLDTSSNIYITGFNLSFGASNYDTFIAKYNNTGFQQWNSSWGGIGNDYSYGIMLDASGNIYITGSTQPIQYGDYDAFIVMYDITGNFQWNITWGGDDDDKGCSITLDVSANIYITGETKSFGAGENDAYIAKYLSGEGSDHYDQSGIIPGYNLFFLIGLFGLLSFILVKKHHKQS